MRRQRLTFLWATWLAAAVVLVAMTPDTLAHTVRLQVDPANPMVLAGGHRTAYVRIALTGIRPSVTRRAPVNVAIVLDRSGSMSGRKIEEAKRAAVMALDWLGDDDILSVITYDSTVNVLVPATKLRDRLAIRNAIRGIGPGGSTALFGGVSKGAQEVRKFLDRNSVNLVILLSDGLANVGPRSPGDLGQLGASLAREGIAVTTIGLGLDYNEDLMTRLAYRSDGNHFFVEDAGDLTAAYATEFGDALSVVAQDVGIEIYCPETVRPIRVLGRDADINGRRVYTSMNQLYGEQTRYLILEVEILADRTRGARRIADVSVDYADLGTGRRARLSGDASVSFTGSPAIVGRAVNRDVMASVVRLIGADQAERAMALRDAGKIEEAQRAYLENARFLEQEAKRLGDKSLDKDAVTNAHASQNVVDEEEWNRERKAQQEYQLKTRQQRNYIEKDEGKKKD